jgi:hypothetical protein
MRCAKPAVRCTFGVARAFISASVRQTWETEKGDKNMKTLNTFVLAMSAAAMLGTTGLYAQSGVVANVPFNFTVETVKMPSGEYTLQPLSTASGVIQLMNRETGKSVLVNASGLLSIHKGKGEETGMIIFHRYGDRYFFSEVWTPYGIRGHAKPSKLEREIQASTAEKQVALVSIPLAGAGQ